MSIETRSCSCAPGTSLDGPYADCPHDNGEWIRCDYCGESIPEGSPSVALFIGQDWHLDCVTEAKGRPGFLDPIEGVA